VDQSNVPGTVDEHPNWRRKLPLPLAPARAATRGAAGSGARWSGDPDGERLAAVLAAAGRGCAQAARIPVSTCRLQLNRDFGFEAAREILPYLARLGIGDLYCSPVQRARPGSRHGYDVVDPRRISPELGAESGFDALTAAAHRRGMGLLLDIVPNRMAVLAADNPWWQDVLEHGQASDYARFFDIDWHPPNPAFDGKLLIPVPGDHYGSVLERGGLELRFDAGQGRFSIAYYEHELPIDPRESAAILRRALAEAELEEAPIGDGDGDGEGSGVGNVGSGGNGNGDGGDRLAAFRALVERFENLPPRTEPDGRAAAASACRRELVRLVDDSASLGVAIDAAVAALNGESPQARDALDALMERQAWRLAYWRVASDEINYRRFFDVNELAGLRVEDPVVFEATHGLVLDLVASGRVDGLRIDHSDGLFDPGAYFARLQSACARRRGVEPPAAGPGRSPAAARVWRPTYVVIEKISAAHE